MNPLRCVFPLLLVASILICGCSNAVRPGSKQVAVDLFGDKIPVINKERANVTLQDVPPTLQPPAPCDLGQATFAESNEHVFQTVRHLSLEGNVDDVIAKLEQAHLDQPDNPSISRELAFWYWQDGYVDKSIELAKQLLEHCDDDVISHYITARLAARRYENEDALHHYRLALLSTPDGQAWDYRPLVYYYLGDLLLAEDYVTAAIKCYRNFQKHCDDVGQGSLNPAIATLLESIGGSAREQIADAHALKQEYQLAADELRLHYSGKTIDADDHRKLTKFLARAGRYEEAAAQALELLRADRGAIAIVETVYDQLNDPHRLQRDVAHLIELYPDDTKLMRAYARALYRTGQRQQAIDYLQQNITQDPQRVDLTWALFELLVHQQRWDDVLDTAADVIKAKDEWAADSAARIRPLAQREGVIESLLSNRSPDSTSIDYAKKYLLGVILHAAGDNDAAGRWLDASITARPDFIPARLARGRMYIETAKWQDALDVASPDSVELAPDTRLEWLKGRACVGLGRLDEAISHFKQAIDLNRSNSEAMMALAEVYISIGQDERALRQLQSLIKVDPLNERAREQLFQAILAANDRRAAAEQIFELRRISAAPTRIARCVAAMEFDPSNPNYERFRETLHTAIEEFRPDVETLHLIAYSYVRQQLYTEAIKVLERAQQLDPYHMPIMELLIGCHRAKLEFEPALELQRKIVSLRPNDPAARYAVLDLLLILQRYKEAIAYGRESMTQPNLDQRFVDAYRATIADTYVVIEDFDGALQVLQDWLEQQPGNTAIVRQIISLLLEADRPDQAMDVLREHTKDDPLPIVAGIGEGIWGKLAPPHADEVVQLLLAVIEQQRDNLLLQIRLIELLRTLDRYDEAVELCNANIAAGVKIEEFQIQLYETYERAGRIDEAVSLLVSMIADSNATASDGPVSTLELRAALAELLIKDGQYTKARRRITRWLEESRMNEERSLYLGFLAICHQESGATTEAAEALQLSMELDPTDTGVGNDLGYLWADAGLHLDRAEELIRAAVADFPRRGAYLDSLGWVRYKKGDLQGAKRWLTMARNSVDGNDPVLYDHLADTCWQLGEKDEAINLWREAVKLAIERYEDSRAATDKRVRQEIEKKLETIESGNNPELAPMVTNNQQ